MPETNNLAIPTSGYQGFDANEVLERLNQATSWESRYREIMLLGKLLPRLPEEFKREDAKVKGCESNVWLYHQHNNGTHTFIVDSDAKIVRGLIYIILALFNGKTSTEIGNTDHTAFFENTGLLKHLSPSRGNGIKAIITEILNNTHVDSNA
ncbi:SufE family protein [Flocculibacter collagenilyticus]|uniref:SufE family protein n=1 Tax=Flocculibacter collagenilyticus TaxID=2744479 RepID=UPI0018F769A2|nr:SufE family protein [Flocculibacter collagenilyticus]